MKNQLHNLRDKYKGTKFAPVFNAFHTFLYTPDYTAGDTGAHVHDATDLKRVMNTVIMALIPCLIFGMFNAGYQHYLQLGEVERVTGFFDSNFWNFDNLLLGMGEILPLVIVSYGVGLGVEFLFAAFKGHEVEEGYLVTGMLVPLIMPIDIPLWMLTLAIIFGVVIGKEVFGGTGMNILNPALTIRAFLFFAYPTWMSGDKVWVAGAVERSEAIAAGANVDAISGETVLGELAQMKEVSFSVFEQFMGFIPGSVGETSTIIIIIMALFMIFTKVASWRIMLSCVLGALTMGLIFNGVTNIGWITPSNSFYGLMSLPFWQHLIVGSLAFGIVYMATDPVSGSQTLKGQWWYGFLIGFFCVMIRVFNPAYPEGVMLAILLMNVFAPTIDYYVYQGNMKRRMKRLKVKKA